MVDTEIVEAGNAEDVKQKNSTRLGQERDFDGVETEADRLTGAQNAPKYTNIMGKFLWRVCDSANPVIHYVVPQLLRNKSVTQELRCQTRCLPKRPRLI